MDINFSIEDYKWLGEANVTLTSDDGFVIKCHQSVLGSIDMNMRLAFYHEKLDFYAVSLTGMNQIMLQRRGLQRRRISQDTIRKTRSSYKQRK